MTVQLSSLRVSADLESSNYTAGANAKVAADKAMAASSQAVGQAISSTDQKISRAGDVLARLSRQYVDGYAAAQRMNSAVSQLARGIETGKISMQQAEPILEGIYRKYGQITVGAEMFERGQHQLAQAISNTNAKMAQQASLADQARAKNAANQNSFGGGNFNASNSAYQIQDIAMMAMLGQSPMATAMQQGPQLAMAIQQGGGLAALGAGLASLVSPVMLVTVGMTAATAAAIQYFTKTTQSAASLEDSLKANRDAINGVANAYDRARKSAEDFGKQSVISAEATERRSRRTLEEALKAERQRIASATSSSGFTLFDFFTDNSSAPVDPRFAAFAEPIMRLRQEMAAGGGDFEAFQKRIDAIADAGSGRFRTFVDGFMRIVGAEPEGLRDSADALLAIVDAAARANAQLRETEGLLRNGRTSAVVGPAAMDRAQRTGREILEQQRKEREQQETIAAARRREQFDADVRGVYARSPQERAAAARAEAAAQYNDGETPATRQDRIELAGKRALIEAEHQLAEAQKERMRSLDATLDSARLDIELIGKSTAETERLRMEHELLAQVREEAARNGVEADEAEIARIKEKAAEYGRLRAIEQARSAIKSQQDDLEMKRAEMSVMGESSAVRTRVIEQLRVEQEIRRLGIDLYGHEANAMRANAAALSDLTEAMSRQKLQQDLMFERAQLLRSAQDQQIASMLKGAGQPIDFGSQEAQMIRYNMQLAEGKELFKGFFTDMASSLRQGKSLWDSFADAVVNALGKIADRFLDTALDNIFGILSGGGSTSRSTGGGFNLGGLIGSLFGGGSSTPSSFKANTTLSDVLGLGSAPVGNVVRMPLGPIAANDNSVLGAGLSSVTSSTGLVAQVNEAFAKNFQGFIGDLEGAGYTIRSLGGYNYRNIAGTGRLSNHAYGNAIDINPLSNPDTGRGGRLITDMPSNVSQMADKWGLSWGGDWRSKKDAMHFEVKDASSASAALEKLAGGAASATGAITSLGSSGLQVSKSLIDAAGGLTNFSSMLTSFMSSSMGGGSSWFQGLMGSFGGIGGALGHMNSISPRATAAILGAGGGFTGLFANGAAFSGGNVIPFARGDVLYSPTYFPMSAGRTGLMGEAGPEAIMPLRRTSDGRLGVAASSERSRQAQTEGRPMTFHQSNTFIMPSAPETPKSQNQIAAKMSEAAQRLSRTA